MPDQRLLQALSILPYGHAVCCALGSYALLLQQGAGEQQQVGLAEKDVPDDLLILHMTLLMVHSGH